MSALANGTVRLTCLSHPDPQSAQPAPSGYKAPENLQAYAVYLDARIRAYKDIKHDAIRVQSESNRDARLSHSLEEEGHRGSSRGRKDAAPPPEQPGLGRSKTVMGRKLRVMTVEKGLLRETRVVQKMIDALVACQVCRLLTGSGSDAY